MIAIFREAVLKLNCECKGVNIYIQVTMIDRKVLTRNMNECLYISFVDVFPLCPLV